jgi:hypothetical protein
MNPLDWLKRRHVLPPALPCVRCAKRIRLSQSIFHDADLGFAHADCLLEYERKSPVVNSW